MQVRPEEAADRAAIRAVHAAAFPTDAEAGLVDRLRVNGRLTLGLVAAVDDAIVGHVAFSPVSVAGRSTGGLGLAPLAVLPSQQRHGVGSQLVRAGLAKCHELGAPFVVLLGHSEYYPRFGFRVASTFGLDNEYGATDSFFAIELQPGGVPPGGGMVRYAPEFAEPG